MILEFKNYQENAVVKLKREINELLDVDGNKVCIFKAPTGSGKTLMMAEFLKRLIDSRIDGKKFSFVWIAVNKLHDQSRNNLKKYYDQNGVGNKIDITAFVVYIVFVMPKPIIDIRRIKKMIKYRKYLGVRETARIIGVDVKTIYRWEKYLKGEIKVSKKSVGKLSTCIHLTHN